MHFRFLSISIFVVLLGAAAPLPLHAQSNEQAVSAAKEAAQEWLALLDADEYEATWEDAASFFKSKLSAEQWRQRIEQAHASLGELQSRSLVAARHTTSVPNAPEGEYVISQYRATYSDKETVETVSLKKEQDTWRIAGYFIRPANQQ